MKNTFPFSHNTDDPKQAVGRPMILPIIFCLICGILLILLKKEAVTITAYVLAGVMCLCGIWSVIAYKRSAPVQRISGALLAIGLILLVAGVLLAFNPKLLEVLLPKIWGLALVFGGFLKIQYAFDERSVSVSKWWIMLILAAFSIFIGILSLMEPAFLGAEDGKYLAIGIMLVAEAVLDIVVFFLLKYALMKKENEEAAALLAAANAPDTEKSDSETDTSADGKISDETAESGDADTSNGSEEPEVSAAASDNP